MSSPRFVLIFDGVCRLCNGVVRFIVARDAARAFTFCALQSRAAAPLLARAGVTPEDALRSFVLLDGELVLRRSDAALAIAAALPQPWHSLAYAGYCVPRVFRDAVYDCVASRRYAIFGKTTAEGEGCLAPTRAVLSRFLDADEIREEQRAQAQSKRAGDVGGGSSAPAAGRAKVE